MATTPGMAFGVVSVQEILCSRCHFVVAGRSGPTQWWAETSAGHLCSPCFLAVCADKGGIANFEVSYIHTVDPIDPGPVMRVWSLMTQIAALRRSSGHPDPDLDPLLEEALSLLHETMIGTPLPGGRLLGTPPDDPGGDAAGGAQRRGPRGDVWPGR